MKKQAWDIICGKTDYEKIKSDDAFHKLLTLARLVNALRFCQEAAIGAEVGDNPSDDRSRINSFLFTISILYEGFLLVEKLGQYYADHDSFKHGFGMLLRDKQVKNLRESVLKRARNKIVFHFDKDVAEKALYNYDMPAMIFASGVGKANSEIYFTLADELSVNYLLQPKENESNDSLIKRFNKIVKDSTDIMKTFSESAELLIADVLKEKGFTVKFK